MALLSHYNTMDTPALLTYLQRNIELSNASTT